MATASRAIAAATILAGLALTGCGDPHDGRMEITGTVKLKNQTIKDGAIVEFAPLDGQGTGASAMTAGGAFTIPRDRGLKPGKYLVRISAGDGKTAVNPVDADSPPGPGGGTNILSKDLVPADWNINSKQERSVTKEGPNAFEFAIP